MQSSLFLISDELKELFHISKFGINSLQSNRNSYIKTCKNWVSYHMPLHILFWLFFPHGKSTLNIHWKDWCWSWSSNTWPPDAKNWLIGKKKNPDAGQEWGQAKKGATEDETVGWHHWLKGWVLSTLQDIVNAREAWCAAFRGVTKSQTWLTNWKTTTTPLHILFRLFFPHGKKMIHVKCSQI